LLECDYFPYLAAAALLAISLRSSGDSFSALALPPFNQPPQAHGNASSVASGTGTRTGGGVEPLLPFYLRLPGKGCEFNFVLVLHKYPLLS